MKRFSLVLVGLAVAVVSLGAKETLKKEFDVGSAPELIVNVDCGRISVQRGDNDKIVVYVEMDNRDRCQISSTQDGDEVRVELEHKGKGVVGCFFFTFNVVSGEEPWIKVEVPAKCDLDITNDAGRIEIRGGIEGTIKAHTCFGTIRMNDLTGDIRARATGGSISADEIAGRLDAETRTGGITVSDSKGEFIIETSAGSIELEHVSGSFRVRSSVGTIDFDGAITEGEDNYLKTAVGSIEVRLNAVSDLEIDAETDMGSVSIFPGAETIDAGEHHLLFRAGDGSKRLRLRSEVGSIRIERGTLLLKDRKAEVSQPSAEDKKAEVDRPSAEDRKSDAIVEDVKPEESETEPVNEEIE